MNKDLLLDGIQYISASRAAEKTGYTSDYIGQLCRDEKVPGKMIGRTWYVDFSSLLDYKQNNSKKKKNIFIEPASKVISLSQQSFLPPLKKKVGRLSLIKYPAVTTPSRQPEIKKIAARPKKQLSLFGIASIATAVFIVGSIVFNWTQYFEANTTSSITARLADVSVSVRQPAATDVSQGMVVTQDAGDRQSLIDRIKASFSDNVNVSLDQTGGSGVITPIFSTSTGSSTPDNYAFVMVPVKAQSQ